MDSDEGCRASPHDVEHPPPSPASAHSLASVSSRSDPHASPRLGIPVRAQRYWRESVATTASDAPSLAEGEAAPAPPRSVASASTSSSASPPPPPALPPPPAPLPAAYAHPQLEAMGTPHRRRPPLPVPPAHGSRFVPLHPPPAPPASSSEGKGKAPEGAAGEGHHLTAAEEKAAARARAQGLEELFPLRAPPPTAGAGAWDALDSPASPAGTELPGYVDPVGVQRRGTLAKRAGAREGDPDDDTWEKRAQAEADARDRVNADALRTVEEDAAATKAALARRAAEEERERAAVEAERRAREVEKRLEAQRVLHEEEEEEEPPPPISPDTGRDEMLPLVDRKDPVSPSVYGAEPPSRVEPALASYRLPPPPVSTSTSTAAYALPTALPPAVDEDYFSQPLARQPFIAPAHTAPIAPSSLHHRPVPTRYATLASSTRSELYPGGLAASTSDSRHFPATDGNLRSPGARRGSLGPAHAFYSTGVGQVTLRSLTAPQQLAPPVARGSSSSPTTPSSPEFPGETSGSRHRTSMSWSTPAATSGFTPASEPYSARSMTASSSGSPSLYGSTASAVRSPALSRSVGVGSAPGQPTSAYLPSPAPAAHAATSFPAGASPAFYTSLMPGGPLLPFYAAPASSPGQPMSYFSPGAARMVPSLPPPPAQPVFATLPPHGAHAFAPAPSPALRPSGGALSPSPGLQRTSPSPSQPSSRPWSRSSAGSPAQQPQPPGPDDRPREKRTSTIRSLFRQRRGAAGLGESGGGGAATGLAGTPEEEEGAGTGSSVWAWQR